MITNDLFFQKEVHKPQNMGVEFGTGERRMVESEDF